MKRATYLLCILFLLLLTGCSSNELDGVTYTLSDNGSYYIAVSADRSLAGEIIIPDEFKNKPVREIGESAFDGCVNIESIVMTENVVTICDKAFYGCNNLKCVKMPSVMDLSTSAFYGCTAVEELVIPADFLMQLRLASHNTLNLDSIRKITITPGFATTVVTSEVFSECENIIELSIEVGITEIGSSAFESCKNLEVVSLPDGLLTIGDSAFWGCKGIKEIVIPNTVTLIEGGAFGYCKGITSVYLPDSIEGVGKSAFYGCESLSEVRLSENMTSIASDVFSKCPITTIIIPQKICRIQCSAFENTNLQFAQFEDTSGWSLWTDQAIPQSSEISEEGMADGYWIAELLRRNYVDGIGRIKEIESI